MDQNEPKQKPKISEEARLKNNARTKAWREANPDYMKKYSKKYRQENHEEMKAKDREYHAAHREKQNTYRRQWSIDNKEKEQAGRKRWYQENKNGKYLDTTLKAKYGITLEQYQQLLAKQGGTCAICSKTDAGVSDGRRLHVDHDHLTGKVRGLLCHFHNTALGAFTDSPESLQKAIAYLVAAAA